MSVVPLISAAMPVPEPPPVTWIFALGFFCMYTSAHFWPRMTIVSEPFTVTPCAPAIAAEPPSASAASIAIHIVLLMNASPLDFADLATRRRSEDELRLNAPAEVVLVRDLVVDVLDAVLIHRAEVRLQLQVVLREV